MTDLTEDFELLKNSKKALRILNSIKEHDYSPGNEKKKFDLFMIYLYGKDNVTANYRQAILWLKKIHSDDPKVKMLLGEAYYHEGLYYSKLPEQNSNTIDKMIRCFYESAEKKYIPAIKKLEAIAEKGNVEVMLFLAREYRFFNNFEAQKYWYQKAANAGNTGAKRWLGDYYRKSEPELAIQWYRKAAEDGDSSAKAMLGEYYFYGKIVPQDYKKAMELLLDSAKNGNEKSQRLIGDMFFFGLGVEVDYEKAVKWYEEAAIWSPGYWVDFEAVYKLAVIYFFGIGVEKDLQKADRWFENLASNLGNKSIFNWGKISDIKQELISIFDPSLDLTENYHTADKFRLENT
ncbi:tetratricopeptide repeat protein [Breznakiella homolactica]|uniref:Sel1 repeat family protein n=1 Tax=Breznakiella homolactica TaxID=2798577 RepID=A0A7T7XNL4_9SPIR|nr:tetratricopeptide repeat protein [Breznakiella homolactica]QQO09631.1 sel1 repeat family protein [Breznakiella homolactica]